MLPALRVVGNQRRNRVKLEFGTLQTKQTLMREDAIVFDVRPSVGRQAYRHGHRVHQRVHLAGAAHHKALLCEQCDAQSLISSKHWYIYLYIRKITHPLLLALQQMHGTRSLDVGQEPHRMRAMQSFNGAQVARWTRRAARVLAIRFVCGQHVDAAARRRG